MFLLLIMEKEILINNEVFNVDSINYKKFKDGGIIFGNLEIKCFKIILK